MDVTDVVDDANPEERAFWLSLPDMFKTMSQQAVLGNCLWDRNGTEKLIVHLRVYDILRRLSYVSTGDEATPREVVQCMKRVMENDDLREFILGYAYSGRFPDTATWKALADKDAAVVP
jgi:hypothetical protein